jgi:ParB family chromosome partitioning protein
VCAVGAIQRCTHNKSGSAKDSPRKSNRNCRSRFRQEKPNLPKLARIPLADIDEPKNPGRVAMDTGKMDELKDSMREIGLLQPILLRRVDGRYEIEAGHRRFLAAKALGWSEMHALVFKDDEIVAGAAMLAENIIREDMSAAEEAILFAEAQESLKLDEAGLVARFRRSSDYIADRLRLLRDDPQVFNAQLERKINFSVARELNKCGDESHRRYLLDAAIRGEVGARVVAEWVRDWRRNELPQTTAAPVTVASEAVSTPEPSGPACFFCGGAKDPYNLVNVYIHKWELAQIQRALRNAEAEEQCESNGSKSPDGAASR